MQFFYSKNIVNEYIILENQEILNHDWKLNVFSLGNGMLPLGQFENGKPLKAMSLINYFKDIVEPNKKFKKPKSE